MKVTVMGATDGLGASLAACLGTNALSFTATPPEDPGGVVIVVGADPLPTPAPLVATGPHTWVDDAEGVIQQTMRLLQQSRDAIRTGAGGGHIVIITPTVSLTGSASLVPYTTAIEGVRAMAKSAARQWGREDIRLNFIAVPLWLMAPEIGDLPSHLTPPAVRDKEALLPSVVSSIEFLLGEGVPGLSGTTIVADGGSVMMP